MKTGWYNIYWYFISTPDKAYCDGQFWWIDGTKFARNIFAKVIPIN